MSGSRIDDLSILAVLAVGALALLILVRHQPKHALLVFVMSVCFVPYWVGREVGPFIPAVIALTVLLVAALGPRTSLRMAVPDIVLALVIGTALASFALRIVSLSAAYTAVVEWGFPYLLGRLIAARLPQAVVATCVAVPFTVVAGLALVEFATGTNPFVAVGPANALHAVWGDQQLRAGLARAEGAFGHSIALGACLAMAVPMVWASRLTAAWKVTSLCLVLGAAVVTLSRIGMVTALLAVVLSFYSLRSELSQRGRLAVSGILAVGAAAAAPYVFGLFSEAGDEAHFSAAYRSDLVGLLPSLDLLGQSTSRFRDASGVAGFGEFRSVDNALLLIGLTLGAIPLVLLLVAGLLAVVRVLRPAPPAALVAVVASLPALTSVAFITQYTVFFWFMAGLAATAAPLPGRDGGDRSLSRGIGPSAQQSVPKVDLVSRRAPAHHPTR